MCVWGGGGDSLEKAVRIDSSLACETIDKHNGIQRGQWTGTVRGLLHGAWAST